MKNENLAPTQMSDDQLLAQFDQTQQVEFVAELFFRYSHLIFYVARKYFKSQQDCEDVSMSVYEIMQKSLKKSCPRDFKSWLYTIVKNECISILRKSKKLQDSQEKLNNTEKSEIDFVEISELQRLTSEDFSEREIESKIKESINTLKENQKVCIKLFFFEELSYQQIVEVTSFSLNEVKSYLQNGKRNLKLQLQTWLKKGKVK